MHGEVLYKNVCFVIVTRQHGRRFRVSVSVSTQMYPLSDDIFVRYFEHVPNAFVCCLQLAHRHVKLESRTRHLANATIEIDSAS